MARAGSLQSWGSWLPQALALGIPPLSTCAALSGTAQASSRHHASTASPDAGRSSAADGAAGAQPGRRRGPFPPGRRRVEANDTALQGRLLQIDALPAHASRDDVLDIFAACGIPMAVRDVQPAFAQSSLHLLPRVHHWEATLGTPQLRDRALRLLRAQRVALRRVQVNPIPHRHSLMWLDEFAADSCGSFLFVGGLPERMSGSDIATAFADYAVLPPSQHSVVTRFVFAQGRVNRASRSAVLKMASPEEAARAVLTVQHTPLKLPHSDADDEAAHVRCMVLP